MVIIALLLLTKKNGIQYFEEFEEIGYKGYKGICTWDIIDFIHKLIGNEYEIIKPKKENRRYEMTRCCVVNAR